MMPSFSSIYAMNSLGWTSRYMEMLVSKKESFGINYVNKAELTARSIEEAPVPEASTQELEARQPLVFI
jgi:hypothetical protein